MEIVNITCTCNFYRIFFFFKYCPPTYMYNEIANILITTQNKGMMHFSFIRTTPLFKVLFIICTFAIVNVYTLRDIRCQYRYIYIYMNLA